ncbi:D-hexose-6-phosphate mutarotase [Lacimicrobium alkaliphilum]|uniref:Putative glucose-6-phosphate 1-epimerase n=1 Tax=Lacimicrobium alkaliphilum TaxID=1526571 RepID=A0ABQ1RBK3_9ALTE|nr:D-hexose-6-phosphate mutarotase [Lacimicrobium alkaliphilum]GGD64196.1 D-hexose-6-phosphate mutarotase [Lacimicrobium alkaliphilum]
MKLSANVSQRTSDQGLKLINVDNQAASLELSLFGGHILSFVPKADNRQRLWLSPDAVMDGSKAIRGGIPVCWPWFAAHQQPGLPAHGFLRNQTWHIGRIDDEPNRTELVLTPGQVEGEGFDGDADVSLVIVVSEQLSISLVTRNTGDTPFEFRAALHSYFNLSDISQAQIQGLSGEYIDKVQQNSLQTTPAPYTISGETDRIHLSSAQKVLLQEDKDQTTIGSAGHDSIVVWNPGPEKVRQMADMPDQHYKHMLCVETAITQGKSLQAGETHILTQTIG